MQLIVLADALQREEFFTATSGVDVVWIQEEEQFLQYTNADAFLDLEFINEEMRVALLARLLPKPVIINSVTDTLKDIHSSFVRINGWNGFLSSTITEGACQDVAIQQNVSKLFSNLGRKIEWLPDEPGFITPRVISMIINEAFISLGEGVSTKEAIDTAMKLGTAYPYGPFAWAEKIGLQNIVTLLKKLSETQPRYAPSEWMVQETNKAI